MPDENDRAIAQEQIERRRLARLLDALPVFSGYVSPDGHLSRTQTETDVSFLWSLPAFSYAHDSVAQIVDLCEAAARGERVQVERPYWKTGPDTPGHYREGLLTMTPIFNEKDDVDEIAVSLIDCDEIGRTQVGDFAKSRLSNANQRISVMLDLAQTVIEASETSGQNDRDRLKRRLDALASVIDLISDPSRSHISLATLIETIVLDLPDAADRGPLQIDLNETKVPILIVPLVALLLSELFDNAARYGAWRRHEGDPVGIVSIQADVLHDGAQSASLHLHWTEDKGPEVSAVINRGFGIMLAERLFPQLTGGSSQMLNSEEGISWSFRCPILTDETGSGRGGPQ